ncbi:BspR family type III secretion system anti-sigma factor [Castellaniella sp. WN]
MHTDPTASFPPPGIPGLDRFEAAAQNTEVVYITISRQSMQVLGTGRTPSGREAAWVSPDVDTTRMFVLALSNRYGADIADAVANRLNLDAKPGKPLDSRTVVDAVEMARTSAQVLSGVDFATRLKYSATTRGTGFHAACRELNIDPASVDARRIDQAMQNKFEDAAARNQYPVTAETAREWLKALLRPSL